MNKAEMIRVISAALGRSLSGTGFVFRKHDEGFVRKISGGRQVLGLPLWDYQPEFVFSLNICIRIDEAEDLFHLFSGAPSEYRNLGFTAVVRLKQFMGDVAQFNVVTSDDVESAVRVLGPVIVGSIVPFLYEHDNIAALHRKVNCEAPGIDTTVQPARAMHAAILAKLAGGDLEAVVARQRADMQFTDPAFEQLVEHLRQMPPASKVTV